MRYSHEYKLKCIELYRQVIWFETFRSPKIKIYSKNKMDATCKVQNSIHVFCLVYNMCQNFSYISNW